MSMSRTVVGDSDFVRYKKYIIVNLPDNFTASDIEVLEGQVLGCLATNKKVKGVLLGLNAVATSDLNDLLRLNAMLQSATLMGAEIGIFGMHPGLAALIAKLKIRLPIQAAGHDLEDLLARFKT